MAVLAFQVGYQSAIAISPLGHMVALSSTEPVQPHRPHSLLALPLAGPGLRLQIAMGLILRTHSDHFFFFLVPRHIFFGNPMYYTVYGILQARILEWVAIPFSRDLPNPGIDPRSPALQEDSLPVEPHGKPPDTYFFLE